MLHMNKMHVTKRRKLVVAPRSVQKSIDVGDSRKHGKLKSSVKPRYVFSMQNLYGSSLKFDPTFNGPLNKRSCTDVLCLLMFIAFLAAWAIAGVFAFTYGDPARLLVPTDSEGYRCGMDDIVKDKKFLVFFDLSKCATANAVVTGCDTPQVCVEKCPVINFSSDLYGVPGLDGPFTDQEKLICKYGVDTTSVTKLSQMRALVANKDCASWYLISQHLHGRCIPIKDSQTRTIVLATLSELPKMLDALLSRVTDNPRTHEIGQMMVEDLAKSWYWILAMLLLAMICCLIFIVLMRWFAGVMVWISLIGVHVLLGYGIYACYAKYKQLEAANESVSLAGLTIEEQAKALMAKKETWMAFLVIISILLAIVLLLTIFLRSRIVIAIALIGEASKAVGSVWSTLAFPLVPWVLQCIVIAWTVALILFLASSGTEVFKVTGVGNGTQCVCSDGTTMSDGTVCDMARFNETCKAGGGSGGCADADCHFYKFETDKYVMYLHAVNVFGLFWGLFFVSALGEMVLASTFATWYWTYNKADVPFFTLTGGFLRTVRYHLGTLAFGSLILAICRMIRVLLEFVDNQLKKYDNFVTRCMLCCCKCFFWCLENFIKFLNRNAYIMCAVHGKGFCASAKDAFNLLMRNVIRVFVLDKVTDFLLLLGKLLITAGICALAFFLFEQKLVIPVDELEFPSLNYSWLPIFLVTVGTYFIATIFFGVYAMAVDTLFLCFLEDSERNDGSIEKPYFMSKSLRKIIGKKNKKAK